MSSVGAVKKLEYTFRSDDKMRLLECRDSDCHGSYAWANRYKYFLPYQIMVVYRCCDSRMRTSFFDAVDISNRHKKVIVNSCFIIQVIAEYISTLIDRDNAIRCFARPRDGY